MNEPLYLLYKDEAQNSHDHCVSGEGHSSGSEALRVTLNIYMEKERVIFERRGCS